MKLWLFPLISLAAVACNKNTDKPAAAANDSPPKENAPAPGVPATELVAFQTGAQWVYDIQKQIKTKTNEGGDEGEFTIKATKVTESDNGQVVNLSTIDPDMNSSMVWRIGPDGLLQSSGLDKEGQSRGFDPPMPLLPPTLEAGQKIGWKGTGVRLDGTVGPIDLVITVIGEEEPDTAMGPMKAWLVESIAVWGGDEKNQTRARTQSWWSPKVGLVRMIRELDAPEYGLKTVLRLKSHTVKQ